MPTHAVIWEYQERGSNEWKEADSTTLLFRLLPSGVVAQYREKAKEFDRAHHGAPCPGERPS